MSHTPRVDEYSIEVIGAAAEQLAADRSWDHTDLTYIQAMAELAATARWLITTTITEMDPNQRDWDQIADALGTTPARARDDYPLPTPWPPAPAGSSTDF